MKCAAPDAELLRQLADIPEVRLSGFSVREGLAGTGVTVLKGRNYFGSWRATVQGELVWTFADLSEPGRTVASVDEALRYTLLLILASIAKTHNIRPKITRTG
ncbi:hypothetical protein HYPDE_35993 [Hyphomicrobium denitrificans 1NES1]|uniref:Uncharacterized protein n=1 Tax=Hyphomicrobium denitrificans 1NES1 TaxID=670307 RepID=N0BFH8_9HYPH|nr:hypothetical protein [Hyphomicrobium denitrificans]AGK58870.1 hypothetical protein HYPDE_35993 [Hyphomicrobium denitrificans 1NES1]